MTRAVVLPTLQEREQEIVAGVTRVAEALADIRERRLYKETHSSWSAYCKERLHLSESAANRQILQAKAVAEIASGAPIPSQRSLAPPKVTRARVGFDPLADPANTPGLPLNLRNQLSDGIPPKVARARATFDPETEVRAALETQVSDGNKPNLKKALASVTQSANTPGLQSGDMPRSKPSELITPIAGGDPKEGRVFTPERPSILAEIAQAAESTGMSWNEWVEAACQRALDFVNEPPPAEVPVPKAKKEGQLSRAAKKKAADKVIRSANSPARPIMALAGARSYSVEQSKCGHKFRDRFGVCVACGNAR